MIRAEKLVYDYIVTEDELEGTTKVKRALDGLDFSVKEGEFIAILGRNGSGKSTLARHINALLYPSSGTLWIRNMRTDDPDHLWDIRGAAGMVFQNPDNQIVASLVEEDVGFGPENVGIPTEEIWQRVGESLKSVGMSEYAKTAPHRLSGGQKQRVAIAGVLAMRPACIVLDEATAMLDPKGRREILDTVTMLNREKGITILLITHHMEEAALADRILVMEEGRLVMDGSPREIFARSEELSRWGLTLPATAALAQALRGAGLPLPEGLYQEEILVKVILELAKRKGLLP